MHFDPNAIIGLIGGFLAVAAYFKSSQIEGLRTRIDNQDKTIASQQKDIDKLSAKLLIVETERDSARKEIVSHYTARTELANENRELHQKIEERDEQVITLQQKVIEVQNNTLRCMAQ